MQIPDDIAFTILSKLPLKSLKRFTLVRKSWADLLETPHFMNMFRSNLLSKHQSFYDGASLLFLRQQTSDGMHYHGALHLISGDQEFDKKRVQLDWPPFQQLGRYIAVVGSGIHGVLCLEEVLTNNFVLWNPATKEFRITPPSPGEALPYLEAMVTTHGFGYDPVTDDFKVICHVTYFPDHRTPDDYLSEVEVEVEDEDEDEDEDGWPVVDQDGWQVEDNWQVEVEHNWQVEVEDDWQYEVEHDLQDEPMISNPLPSPFPEDFWEIYSLRSNSWRKLEADMPIIGGGPHMGSDIYMNGVCHWLGCGPSDQYGFDVYMGSFDFSNEGYVTTLLPLDLVRVRICLVALNESVGVISKHEETTTFHISILGELGMKESWTKLFIVGPLHGVGHPITVGRKGDIFFKNDNGELDLFDLSTQVLKEMVAKGIVVEDQMIIYKESLLPIGKTVGGPVSYRKQVDVTLKRLSTEYESLVNLVNMSSKFQPLLLTQKAIIENNKMTVTEFFVNGTTQANRNPAPNTTVQASLASGQNSSVDFIPQCNGGRNCKPRGCGYGGRGGRGRGD